MTYGLAGIGGDLLVVQETDIFTSKGAVRKLAEGVELHSLRGNDWSFAEDTTALGVLQHLILILFRKIPLVVSPNAATMSISGEGEGIKGWVG
jgi:hypothetical protein